jgi:hypothetical protein
MLPPEKNQRERVARNEERFRSNQQPGKFAEQEKCRVHQITGPDLPMWSDCSSCQAGQIM